MDGNVSLTISKNLKLLRTFSEYTQESLSEKLNVSRSTYSQYESGRRTISHDVLFNLSKLYHVPISIFYEYDLCSTFIADYEIKEIGYNILSIEALFSELSACEKNKLIAQLNKLNNFYFSSSIGLDI